MTTSDQLGELGAALARAQAQIQGARKDSANPFFRSTYADLASVWEACRAALTAQGLSVAQAPRTRVLETTAPEVVARRTKSGEDRDYVRALVEVVVETTVLHASGQWMRAETACLLPSGEPQAVGSAITYLRRYGLAAMVGVAPEDDDAEGATRGSHARRATTDALGDAMPATVPEGYHDWLLDLQAVADEGTARLKAAWDASPMDYRAYLTTTAKAQWEALKARAAKAGVAA